MSSKTVSHGTSTRIDHLSRLPNELLEDIFDHTYSTSPPPPKPISKRLLPFHQKHLYRQVSLSSSSRVKKFLASVSNDKEKGKIVKAIQFDPTTRGVIQSLEVLENLFPLLPNLQYFGIHSCAIRISSRSKKLFSTLTTVTAVSTGVSRNADGLIDLNYFSFLSALPSLDTLRVLSWPTTDYELLDGMKDFSLPGVKTLTVLGEGAEDATVVGLVEILPALLHLELTTTYHNMTSFSNCLPRLPSSLDSLKVASTNPKPNITPKDRHLLRFTNLRSLDLGDGCYSSEIHTTLQQLPMLKKIRLGGGAISPDGVLTLFSGSARLVHLELLVLDLYVGQRGIRADNEPGLWRGRGMRDWKLPQGSAKEAENGIGDEYPLQIDQLRHLIEVAGDNGVEVMGTIREALENLEDYWIEKNNREVLTAHAQQDDKFHLLRGVRIGAAKYGIALPALNVDALDSTRLELVKIDQPGRDWFVLSLKNEDR